VKLFPITEAINIRLKKLISNMVTERFIKLKSKEKKKIKSENADMSNEK